MAGHAARKGELTPGKWRMSTAYEGAVGTGGSHRGGIRRSTWQRISERRQPGLPGPDRTARPAPHRPEPNRTEMKHSDRDRPRPAKPPCVGHRLTSSVSLLKASIGRGEGKVARWASPR